MRVTARRAARVENEKGRGIEKKSQTNAKGERRLCQCNSLWGRFHRKLLTEQNFINQKGENVLAGVPKTREKYPLGRKLAKVRYRKEKEKLQTPKERRKKRGNQRKACKEKRGGGMTPAFWTRGSCKQERDHGHFYWGGV